MQELKARVRKENHPDIKKEKDALFTFGTNKKVNQINTKQLKALRGNEKVVKAICLPKGIKNFKPITNNDGNVSSTPFQNELKLKLRAKVM